MAKRNETHDNLGFLGDAYQEQLVKYLIEDKTFFCNMEPILDPNMFTDERYTRIVGFMKERFERTETTMSYTELDIAVRSKVTDPNTRDILCATLKKLRDDVKYIGIDIIVDQCEKFFKQQNLIKAINKATDIVKCGDINRYDETILLFEKVLEVNTKKSNEFRVFDNFEDAFNEDYRITMRTGSEEIDKALMGGIAKGELGAIIASSGTGKTSATTGFAAAAATEKCAANNYKGWKVLHIFFEDDIVNVKRKYFGYLTGYEASTLSRPDVRPYAVQMLNTTLLEERRMIQENIIGMREVNHELSASDIKMKIKHCIATGFKPDLIVIDYFECLKLEKPETSSDSEWTREGLTMRKLESIAHECDVGIWIPIQGSKDSVDAEFVNMAQGGGSFKKVQIAHIVMSFSKTPEQRERGDVMNVSINKFRAGAIVGGGRIRDIEFNNGTCRFGKSAGHIIEEIINDSGAKYDQAVQEARNK